MLILKKNVCVDNKMNNHNKAVERDDITNNNIQCQ